MPGTNIMCVWHAAYIRDGGAQSAGLKQSVLKAVVAQVAGAAGAVFSPAEFDGIFPPEQTPRFDNFAAYFRRQLTAGILGNKYEQFVTAVEKACWSICVMAYQPRMLYFEEDKENLWQIFNRLSDEGSYPPVAHEAEVTWLTSRIASGLGVTYREIDNFPEGGLSFQALLDYLERHYFITLALTSRIHETISDIHAFCVLQILHTGWMNKRTKKQANWTNWQRRFFVHEPGKLTYYEDEARTDKKGEVLIDANSRVEALDNFKSMLKKNLTGRFKITVSATYEIELATGDDNQRRLWMASVQDNVLAARDGLSLFQQQIRDRRHKLSNTTRPLLSAGSSGISTPSSSPPTSGRSSPTLAAQKTSAVPSAPVPAAPPATNGATPTGAVSTVQQPRKGKGGFNALAPKPQAYANVSAEEDFDNNFDYEKQKIEAIFFRIDKDGNGRIHVAEFREFLRHGLHLNMSDSEIDLVFNTIDKKRNGSVGFDDFYDYFIRFVLDEESTGAETQIRAAFLQADRNGTGTIDFREFSDFVWTRRQTITTKRIAEIFDEMDKSKQGEVSYDDFRSFINRQGSLKALALKGIDNGEGQGPTTNINHLESQLRNMYNDSDASEIITYLRNRWKAFASFKRFGGQGELVMTGGSGMVADVLPGEYTLLDLACFNDLPPIVPHHVEIKGMQWISSTVPGVSGKLLFPENFDGRLPIDIATNEHLAYYGCSLADSSQMKVALLYRHGIQDFTYQNNYLDEYVKDEHKLGGGGLEHHDFAHLDCPLENDSGYFVIGKLVNKTELHLTAFKVPTRHTLYLPPNVIHSNDYLKGTWRTMLTDEVDIDHVSIVRSRRKGMVTEMEHFTFAFYS